ncbi:MAG: DUF4166 domain-containing protein [Methylophagaceae bacterium]
MNAFIKHVGEDFQHLHSVVQQAHIGDIKLSGNVRVSRGNFLANILCQILGMPKSTESVLLTVDGQHTAEAMVWKRRFGDVEMISNFVLDGDYFVENMGPIKLWMMLNNQDGELVYTLEKSQFLFIPLPKILSPTLLAFESENKGKYVFSVSVGLPIIGKLIEYSGELDLESNRK